MATDWNKFWNTLGTSIANAQPGTMPTPGTTTYPTGYTPPAWPPAEPPPAPPASSAPEWWAGTSFIFGLAVPNKALILGAIAGFVVWRRSTRRK